MNYRRENNIIIVDLGDKLDKESILTYHQVLLTVFKLCEESKASITFSGGRVIFADTAALQLLLSFSLSASKEGIPWRWKDASTNMVNISKLLGMKELLQLPEK